jgi:large subunit ribosomal protein L25
MKSVEIKAKLRTNLGKSANKKLRKEEMVPGVIYGGAENIYFYAYKNEFTKLVYTPESFLINIDIEGKNYFCHLQETQFHPITDEIIHVDFIEIKETEPIKISLPVKLTGLSVGIKAGGKLKRNMRKIKVKGLVKDLPEFIEVDITHLDIGHSVKIDSLDIENLEILDPKSSVVVMVKSARGVASGMDLEEDEEGAEGETTEGAEGETTEGQTEDTKSEE